MGDVAQEKDMAKRSSRLRFSLLKRGSVVVQSHAQIHTQAPVMAVQASPSTPDAETHASSPPLASPVSPTPSLPNPPYTYTTSAEIAALAAAKEQELIDAANVITRDKPKDWYNSGWREQEEREREERLKEARELEEKDGKAWSEAAGVKLKGKGEGNEDVLKRWEWGR